MRENTMSRLLIKIDSLNSEKENNERHRIAEICTRDLKEYGIESD